MKLDDRRAGPVTDLGRCRDPRLVRFVRLQVDRFVVQLLRGHGIVTDLHLLTLVQGAHVNGVMGEQSVRPSRRQPRYHDGVFAADYRFHSFRCVGDCVEQNRQTELPNFCLSIRKRRARESETRVSSVAKILLRAKHAYTISKR